MMPELMRRPEMHAMQHAWILSLCSFSSSQ